MTDKIILGQYVPSDSVIHRLDPRTKLLILVAFTIGSMHLQAITGYIAATVLAGGQLLLSRVSFRMLLRALRPLLFILLLPMLYHLLFNQEGLRNELFALWRILLLVSLALILTLTTKPLDLAKGLEQLCKPLSRLGVPVEALALTVMLAIRFIPTITQELDRILVAQQARGYDIKDTKGLNRIQAYIQLVIPLLVTTLARAEQLAMTIEARAYGNGKGRTSYRVLKYARMDYAAGGIMLAYVLLGILLER
ncbi:energy-coupling factor transporter transmembrane component T family protein [Paenibacillus sp. FSL R7-0128]|uniref:energy-coupling factor transporter transmembrane component T family protein n=1 Tax=Paenibacillus sp. FSL R7-0128 TaxID=2954529 RepID=UPI0030F52CB0